jgi:hypothetical protein
LPSMTTGVEEKVDICVGRVVCSRVGKRGK